MKASVALVLVAAVAASQGKSIDNLKSFLNIVGGEVAKPGEIPYQAALYKNDYGQVCGGVVLDENRILTAAHCCDGNDPDMITVRVGINSTNEDEQKDAQKRNVSKMVIHEEYTKFINDLCVLHLDTPLVYKDEGQLGAVAPVKLPTKEDDFPAGTMAMVSGFGDTMSPIPVEELMKVEIPIQSDELCDTFYNPIYNHKYHIGAGLTGKGACFGDSGGPLVCGKDRILCGIVSFGRSTCTLDGDPGIYVRVTSYIDWVNEN